MKVTSSIVATRAALAALCPTADDTLALVPTMGALHEGHLSLVRAARLACRRVAVSIFVNPTQFGPTEDLSRYPRTLDDDLRLLHAAGADLAFVPSVSEMYPDGALGSFVDPGELGSRLDGRTRPGHFRGVCTVVCKLLQIVAPDQAFFGQKDAAQVAVLRAMVRDLNLPVTLAVCPTIRDADGLAMSSRNRYLTPGQRVSALALSQALRCAGRAFAGGEHNPVALVDRLRRHLEDAGLRVDYAEAVDADTLLPVSTAAPGTLLAIAAFVGSTRLIDNVLLGTDDGIACTGEPA